MDTGDLVQEVMASAMGQLDRFDASQPGGFAAYLRSSVVNRVRGAFRQVGRRPAAQPLDTGHSSPEPSAEDRMIWSERFERYEKCLDRLDSFDRVLIYLRRELDFSWEEVAREAGEMVSDREDGAITVDASRMRVRRALATLSECVSHERRQAKA